MAVKAQRSFPTLARFAKGRQPDVSIRSDGNPRWLLNYRSEWPLVETRLDDLWLSLDDMESTDQRNQIQDADGSVARGSIEWIFKLDPTIDYIQQKGIELDHIRPLTFLVPLLDPKKLQATVHRLQISDVARRGHNYRSELGSIESTMSQLLFKNGELSKFVTDRRLWPDHSEDQIIEKVEALQASYLDFLRQVQHSRTGYWGPWYVIEDGLETMQDLSFTFHQVSYLKGAVDRWPNIMETTLAIKDQIYPYGWRPSAGSDFSNHHNYDVLTVFKRGWPLVDPSAQRRIANAIFEIFDGSLTISLVREPACGFKRIGDEDNTIDPYYFDVRFLKLAGFWNSADRFWWNSDLNWKADWPDPMQVRARPS